MNNAQAINIDHSVLFCKAKKERKIVDWSVSRSVCYVAPVVVGFPFFILCEI